MPIGHSPKNNNGNEISTSITTANNLATSTQLCTATSRNEFASKRRAEEGELDMTNSNKNMKMDDGEVDDGEVSTQQLLIKIMNEIKANEISRKSESIGIRDEIVALRIDVNQQISGIKSSLDFMTSKVDGLSSKVESIETRTDKIEKKANESSKMINKFNQDRLEKFMEIDGIRDDIIGNANDFKQLAIDTIQSFNITIKPEEIEHAFKKEVTLKKKVNGSDQKKILTVIFSSVNTKIRVMKAKRDQKEGTRIYFNSALTFNNRNLIQEAKKIVNGKLKVYFARGCVRVQKKDKTEIAVDDDSKLGAVESYFNQINQQ